MKKIIVLSLLAVMLTGCVKQADYDDLVKKNAKLESKVEDLEEENDELRDEIKKLKEAPATNVTEETTETPKDTVDTGNVVNAIDVYNNTFTNSDSGSTISIHIYYVDGDFNIISSYTMPTESYFDDVCKAEAAAALYTCYIKEFGAYSEYYMATVESDSYYKPTIFSNADNDTGYTFFAFDRKNKPCYSIEECDWISEFYNDMDNKKYNSAETSWIISCFDETSSALADLAKELGDS